MASETIKFEQVGAVAKITLNRPNVFNSFNREMALALQEVLDICPKEKGLVKLKKVGI